MPRPTRPTRTPVTQSREAVFAVEDVIGDALEYLSLQPRAVRHVGSEIVVDTGRRYSDGDPVLVHVSVPVNPGVFVKVTDAGDTLSRIGHSGDLCPDHALSVRNELLSHLPVQEHQGTVLIVSRPHKAGEAVALLADSCVMLDAAGVIAKHMRPRTVYTVHNS